MGAPPSLLVILFLLPQLFWLCLQPEDVMTLLLPYWLVSSGDHPFVFPLPAHLMFVLWRTYIVGR